MQLPRALQRGPAFSLQSADPGSGPQEVTSRVPDTGPSGRELLGGAEMEEGHRGGAAGLRAGAQTGHSSPRFSLGLSVPHSEVGVPTRTAERPQEWREGHGAEPRT